MTRLWSVFFFFNLSGSWLQATSLRIEGNQGTPEECLGNLQPFKAMKLGWQVASCKLFSKNHKVLDLVCYSVTVCSCQDSCFISVTAKDHRAGPCAALWPEAGSRIGLSNPAGEQLSVGCLKSFDFPNFVWRPLAQVAPDATDSEITKQYRRLSVGHQDSTDSAPLEELTSIAT